jgi:hypothetical protein
VVKSRTSGIGRRFVFGRRAGDGESVCDHSSVPFYMDGSYRAAVDLKP